MYYIIYKTINKLNNKYYIGAHSTKNIFDNYLGSGVAINQAIKKYGVENFQKEIMHICETKEEMYFLEEKLVNINDPQSYNMRRGGKGGWDHVDLRGDNNPMKRPDVVKKVVETCKKNGTYHTESRKIQQKINTKKAADKAKGKKRPEHAAFMEKWAKKLWEENKEKMRDCLSTTFEVVSPEGIVYTTNRLQDFCDTHNLPYTSLWNTTRTNKCVKKGKSKGWKCKIILK